MALSTQLPRCVCAAVLIGRCDLEVTYISHVNTMLVHSSINCAYFLLRSAYMFRRCYLAVFRELTPKSLKT